MKTPFLLPFLLVLLGSSQLGAQALGLESAIESALAARPELKAAALQAELSATQNDKLRAAWMPHVSANGDLRWNPQLLTSVIPIGQFGLPGVPTDAVSKVQFGTAFSNTFGIQAEQRILAPGSGITKEINQLNTQVQLLGVEQQRIAIRQSVSQAYYGALLAHEQMRIAQNAEARAKVRRDDMKVRMETGTAIQDDMDRLELELKLANQARRKAQDDHQLAMDRLAYEMGGSFPKDVQLSDSLPVLSSRTVKYAEKSNSRPDLKMAQLGLRIEELTAESALKQRLPVVSAYAAVGAQQLNNNPNPFESNTWFTNSNLGIRASMVLFDGRTAKLNARDSRYRSRIDSLDIQRIEDSQAFEINEAMTTLQRSILELEEGGQNLELATKVYATDRLRQVAGTSP